MGESHVFAAPPSELLGAYTDGVRKVLAPVGAGVLLVVLGASSGGYFPTSWGWAGLVVAWAAILSLILSNTRLGGLELATVACLAGYVGWVAASRWWSDAPGHTVAEVQRDLIYPLALLTTLLLVRKTAAVALLAAVAIALDGLALYGLLTRLLPERLGTFHSVAAYRLGAPIGYWNALGIVVAMAFVLTFGFAVRGGVPTRVLASCALVTLAPTLYFTSSRGAIAALGLGLAAAVVCDRRRLQLTVAAAAVLPLPIIAARLAGGYSALTTTAAQAQAATHDGHRFGTVLICLVALQIPIALAVAFAQRAVRVPRPVVRGYGVFVAAVAVACAVAVVAHYGGPVSMSQSAYDSFRGPPVGIAWAGSDLNRRFTSLSANGRIDFWREAWRDFERSRLVGSGAGSYEWWWAQHQPYSDKAQDAHSLYAETLAEMGLVGLALIVAALGVPLLALRRVRGEPLMPFAIGAYIAFVAHIGVDWDWEMPVVILAGLFCAAAILLAARRDETAVPLAGPVRVGAIAVVAVSGVLAFAGLISSNALVASRSAEAAGRFGAAARDARKASTWAPWSAEPWKQLAQAQRDLNDLHGARQSLRKAIELEPLDYSAWLDLGNVSNGSARKNAFAQARRLYPFNPLNPVPPGGRG